MAAVVESMKPAETDLPASPVHRAPIHHPSAWMVADFKSSADYTIDLTPAQLADVKRAIGRINEAGLSLDNLQREHFEFRSLQPVIADCVEKVLPQRNWAPLAQ